MKNTKNILVFQEYKNLNLLIKSIVTTIEGVKNIYTISKQEDIVSAYNEVKPDVFLCEINTINQYSKLTEIVNNQTASSTIKKEVICIINEDNNYMRNVTLNDGMNHFLEKPNFCVNKVRNLLIECLGNRHESS
ncbi:hypothetical protein [Evansella tamaricis]|uniref:Response regulatory domain-containing protein n=1 Tax=Evansella tamaricis TaxID=2069301 RepID=A0ABS6J9L8_9BACI|nr:hypothetical protein [Evansella tamaricis]MBU9710208.1 hypothetical protein [Evansella tamaricis]